LSKLKTNKGWTTLSGIYIDKLEECLETAGCKVTELGDIINILLLYVDDIIFLAKIHDDLYKQVKALDAYES